MLSVTALRVRATLTQVGSYLCASDAFGTRGRVAASVCFILAWITLVTLVSASHEMTRDEVRALSTALEAPSIWELPATLKNEGHPVAWYAILRAAYSLVPSYVVLKAAALSIGVAAIVVLTAKSPYPMWQKMLFTLGALGSYEYSVMCRNYGISMLLLFMIAAVYPARHKNTILIGVLLATLANTNVHSCILTVAFAMYWFIDETMMGGDKCTGRNRLRLCFALAVAFAGVLASAATTIPDADTIVTNVRSLTAKEAGAAALQSLVRPATNFIHVFPHTHVPQVVGSLILWLLIAGLALRPHAAAAVLVSMVLLGTLFSVGYRGEMRHEGLFVAFVLTMYWVVEQHRRGEQTRNFRKLEVLRLAARQAGIPVMLAMLFVTAVGWKRSWVADLVVAQSSSREFGEFITSHPEYRNAILVGEPDYYLESLAYYCDNRIYIPREHRFGKRVQFTKAAAPNLSLQELLRIAEELAARERVPVLIAVGFEDLRQSEALVHRYGYNKSFMWTLEELDRFEGATVRVAEFRNAVDENYSVFALRTTY